MFFFCSQNPTKLDNFELFWQRVIACINNYSVNNEYLMEKIKVEVPGVMKQS